MTYRGYKSWRPNSRRNRRAQGGARSRTRSNSTSPATDRTFLLIAGGFFLLVILAMMALVLL